MADDWTDPSYSPYVMPTSSNNTGGGAGGSTTRGRRKSNFTQAEVNMLRKMMRRYAKQLKGRVTNSEDIMERRKIWSKIVDAVNSVSVEERTMLEIKSKWKKCKYEDELGERNGGECVFHFLFSFFFRFCLFANGFIVVVSVTYRVT